MVFIRTNLKERNLFIREDLSDLIFLNIDDDELGDNKENLAGAKLGSALAWLRLS